MAVDSGESVAEPKFYCVKDTMDSLVNDEQESVTFICQPAVDIALVRQVLEPLAMEMGKQVAILIGETERGKLLCESNETVSKWLSKKRCQWADSPLLMYYHDFEWGQKPRTDNQWFEFIVLEIFQAGLSWKTILRKRLGFRIAFQNFDIGKVAEYQEQDIEALMHNSDIVRNRKKLDVTVENAKIALGLQSAHGSLNAFFDSVCILQSEGEILKILQSTFRFVGPTTAQSIATATGLISSDHEEMCFLRETKGGGGNS